MYIYLGVSGFLGLFAVIYYRFSHGVTSPFMTFSFAVPLVLGMLWSLIRKRSGCSEAADNLIPAGIAALTMASLLRGVFDIAGNSSDLVAPLFIVGVSLVAMGMVSAVVSIGANKVCP